MNGLINHIIAWRLSFPVYRFLVGPLVRIRLIAHAFLIMYDNKEFIYLPISGLEVSDYFKEKSKQMGFYTIKEITDLGWGKVLKMDHFCYDWFNELVRLLKSKGLLDLLETK